MKTKIVYISGNEIFDIADIRAAFEEVRNALNLDKTTVLFGVPVDAEDAGFSTQKAENIPECKETEPFEIAEETETPVMTAEIIETVAEIAPESDEKAIEEEKIESVVEQPVKKRGRPRKEDKIEKIDTPVAKETVVEESVVDTPVAKDESDDEEPVVPILSVLSTKDEAPVDEAEPSIEIQIEKVDIIPEIPDALVDEPEEPAESDIEDAEISDDNETDLVRLLSATKPLDEDILEEQISEDIIEDTTPEPDSNDISVDATLEQLATEFAENQDKIAAEAKSSTRSKIGKLRNILPFKQSKHKDQGLGDLFGWAGIAANDEDFSVPGFFTSTASKK